MADDSSDAKSMVISMRSRTVRGSIARGSVFAPCRPICSEGTLRAAVPIRASAAVEAIMVADIIELRRVWTAKISEPG